MTELDDVYWCGICNRQQQPTSGFLCIHCGMSTVVWATKTLRKPPRATWNLNNGFPADATAKDVRNDSRFLLISQAFAQNNRRSPEPKFSTAKLGSSMSTQARFDPNQVAAFAEKLKIYVRTLEDYDSQVTNALQRLGDTFDDDDYQGLCTDFVSTKALLRRMIEASEIEIPRIEAMCADVRANQSVRVGG
jgi:hypothetical protein